MNSKNMDDVQRLIDESSGVYNITTTEIQDETLHQSTQFYQKRSFEGRGLITVIGSTVLATLILLTFLYIQVFYTASYFTEQEKSAMSALAQSDTSSWQTSYDLPEEIVLVEVYPTTFNFSADCPNVERFALVLHLETPISVFENWMKKCGSKVGYFRMDGDPTVEDVDRLVKFVPNAQYIPIKARFHAAQNDDIFSDPDFKSSVEFEGSIVHSLTISGYLTSPMLQAVLEIAPFVEELTIVGPDVCSSLIRPVSKESCTIAWTELSKLRLEGLDNCVKTLDFIRNCWEMNRIEQLEVVENNIDDINVKYIENIIDKYRITKSKFERNICSESTQNTHSYICNYKFCD